MAQIGLNNLHVAKLLTDPKGGPSTYDTPVAISGAISANINPNPNMNTLFADDGPMDTASALGAVELQLNIADIPVTLAALLLGNTVDSNGILVKKSNDVPPYVAIGFASLRSNGSYAYVWLLKGKFMEHQNNHATKNGTVTFTTPTITGRFVKREADDAWQKSIFSDAQDFNAAVATAWFDKPDYTAA